MDEDEAAQLLEGAGCVKLGERLHEGLGRIGDSHGFVIRAAIKEVMSFRDNAKTRTLWYKKNDVLFVAIMQVKNDDGKKG